ncbi:MULTISPECIES: thioredoxin [unclassified Dysgonomonas]|uniref:thioredoxin n=1 Tax=unclassified Dysgonomonas TaxID=2630389 RepID=UPI0009E51621|nr:MULTISPECIES: thioredoxin [unclassified Dysgonomonas]MBD8346799.1 thioredoxin [Dysgonomonas sp. HGC4]MBF0577300.1 thioredoxin [Dysgonomonas sp. GY617]
MKKSIVLSLLFVFSLVIVAQDKKDTKNKIVTLTSKSYDEEVSKGLVLVDYWAVWCGPCRKMEPVLKQVAEETDVKVGKLNVDDYKAVARAKGVSTIPTMFIYKDGKEMQRLVGVYTKDELLKVLNSYK